MDRSIDSIADSGNSNCDNSHENLGVDMTLTSDKCPYCGSGDISGGPVTIEKRKAIQDCDCNNCGKYFEHVFTLTAILTEEYES